MVRDDSYIVGPQIINIVQCICSHFIGLYMYLDIDLHMYLNILII